MLVEWHHDLPDEPYIIACEVQGGYETRKIEIYRGGQMDYADSTRATGTTVLAEELMLTVDEIARGVEFAPREIGRAQFEELWERATQR